MSYTCKNPILDAVPPELCTTDEAKSILGLKSYINLTRPAYKHLHYAYSNINGHRKRLFNRQEILALKKQRKTPRGYLNARQATILYTGIENPTINKINAITDKLHAAGFLPLYAKFPKNHLLWKESDILFLKNKTLNS